jgi:adenosylhomocysteine nucleosidase
MENTAGALTPRSQISKVKYHTCVVTAAGIEFRAVARLLAGGAAGRADGLPVWRGRRGGREVTVCRSEIGAAGFATRLAAHLDRVRYDELVVIGLAGGLDPALRTGEAVVYDRCHGETNSRKKSSPRDENASIACDPDLSAEVEAAVRAAGHPCRRGAGVTVGAVVAASRAKLELGTRYGAAAVDMETYGIAETARRAGIPLAALRVVLDEAGADIPDFNRALRADGRLDHWRLTRVLLARPLATAGFLANLRRAMASLERVSGAARSRSKPAPPHS